MSDRDLRVMSGSCQSQLPWEGGSCPGRHAAMFSTPESRHCELDAGLTLTVLACSSSRPVGLCAEGEEVSPRVEASCRDGCTEKRVRGAASPVCSAYSMRPDLELRWATLPLGGHSLTVSGTAQSGSRSGVEGVL